MGGCRVCAWWCVLVLGACGGKSGNQAATAEGGAGSGVISTAGAGAASGAASGSSGNAGAAGGDDETGGQGSEVVAGAGGEGGAAPEAVPTFCDEHAYQFCADFDDEVYDAGWHSKDEIGGGSLAPSTLQVMSAPRALVSQIAIQEFQTPADATLNVTFPAGATGFALNFDLLIDELVPDPTGATPAWISLFRVLNGDSSLGLSLTFDQQNGDAIWHARSNGMSAQSLGDAIALQTWLHVEVIVSYDVLGAGTYFFRLGDAPEVVWMTTTVGDQPGPLQLQLGVESQLCDTDVRATYDNVTLDLMP